MINGVFQKYHISLQHKQPRIDIIASSKRVFDLPAQPVLVTIILLETLPCTHSNEWQIVSDCSSPHLCLDSDVSFGSDYKEQLVSYIHELITIIMAKREPNGVERSRRNILLLQQCFSPICFRKDLAQRCSIWTDLPLLVSWRLRSSLQVFRLHSCFCKITVRDLQGYAFGMPATSSDKAQIAKCLRLA
jgi:hypothetical protein